MKKIGVVAHRGDIHAQAVMHLAKLRGHSVFQIESDVLHDCAASILLDGKPRPIVVVNDSFGSAHELPDFGAIWWRRPYGKQQIVEQAEAFEYAELINYSSRVHIDGLANCCDSTVFVNEPIAASRSENKIYQLSVAARVGLRVPDTLFSNDSERITSFFFDNDEDVIVKSHFNSEEVQIKTSRLTREMLSDRASLEIAPSIFQRYIPGEHHLRVVAVGDQHQAVCFINSALDSRIDLSCPAMPARLDADTARMCADFLRSAGLAMGVFDFKVDRSGEIYFLEVNQQGQFAYLDAVAGTRSLEMLVSYLFAQAGG